MNETKLLTPLQLIVGLGYCPNCGTETESLPSPAEGTCARCYAHRMKSCKECDNFVSSRHGGLIVGMDRCKGSPDGRWFDWHYARHSETKCGAFAAWGKFPKMKVSGANHDD